MKDSNYFSPDFSESSHERRDNFVARIKATLRSFASSELDLAQQQANIEMSGPGRSHFSPDDRHATSHYPPYSQQSTLSACLDSISIHQMMYGVDPISIGISYAMYFRISADILQKYGIPFNGTLAFIGISGCEMSANVRVYNDRSTDIVICVH